MSENKPQPYSFIDGLFIGMAIVIFIDAVLIWSYEIMGTPHKHAEILKAIADGKDVQYQSLGEWFDYNWEENLSPLNEFGVKRAWRIKPEPKPDYIRIGRFTSENYPPQFNFHSSPLIKLIFDGETNKPKSVELINGKN